MNEEEILKRLDAGESACDLSIEKYRKLYCKVMNGKDLYPSDIDGNSCALCHKYIKKELFCDNCPFAKK